MGKKTQRKYSKVAKEIQYYRWEFLRRNKNYEQELDEFYKKYSWMEILDIKNKEKRRKKLNMYMQVNNNFAKKWGLYFSPNPEYPCPEDDLDCQSDGHKEMMFPYATKPDFYDIEMLAYDEFVTEKNFDCKENFVKWRSKNKPIDLNKIKLEIDLARPKENILYELGRIVDSLKKARKHKGVELKDRNRFSEYRRYLKVYDLKNQGWSWERLAKKYYSGEAGGINYAKQKVRRDYDRCKKLIDGGYRQIR